MQSHAAPPAGLEHSQRTAAPARRVFCCMGNAQLITAMCAARARVHADPRPVADALLIHDLYAPPGQEPAFAASMEQAARSLGDWHAIVHLDRPAVTNLAQQPHLLPLQLGWERVDELYLSQNRLLLNDLVAEVFGSAKKFCYGDSFGLNFSPDYFAPMPTFPRLRSWKLALKNLARRPSSAASRPARVAFDDHLLLFPNRCDERLARFQLVDAEAYRELYHRLGRSLDATEPWFEPLQAVATRPGDVAILMTSNFSESGKMDLDAELAAYEQFLRSTTRKRLVIKPHPRDSHSKISALRDRVASRFQDVVVLDHPSSFYLPFEAVYDRCFAGRPQTPAILCTSSACLPFERLYGVRSELGFGEQAVRRCFRRPWVTHRLNHERDLRAIVADIRHTAKAA